MRAPRLSLSSNYPVSNSVTPFSLQQSLHGSIAPLSAQYEHVLHFLSFTTPPLPVSTSNLSASSCQEIRSSDGSLDIGRLPTPRLPHSRQTQTRYSRHKGRSCRLLVFYSETPFRSVPYNFLGTTGFTRWAESVIFVYPSVATSFAFHTRPPYCVHAGSSSPS